MNKEIIINKNYKIGKNHKPFIIAEMSANHNQSLKRALKIVRAAYKCGADAIKLQTYTPDTLTLDIKKEFLIKDKKVCGKVSLYMNCIKKLIRHGNGTS